MSQLLAFRPQTGMPMSAFAEALLRGPSSLTPGEREIIAAAVSTNNRCTYCSRAHTAVARRMNDAKLVDEVVAGALDHLDARMRALLAIAEWVRANVARVPDALTHAARSAGADDIAIHDTVLVAAAFSMFNRYVEGLGADAPDDEAVYARAGERLSTQGYIPKPP